MLLKGFALCFGCRFPNLLSALYRSLLMAIGHQYGGCLWLEAWSGFFWGTLLEEL
jgi:hypothetical protein